MSEGKNTQPTIVFDFGGVLIDWNPRYLYRNWFDSNPDAMERFLEEIGFNEWNVEQDRGRLFAEAVAELSGRFPHHAELIRAFDDRWEESVGGPIEGTVEILRTLHDRGFKLYGLSNWSAEKFRLVRARYDLFELFDTIFLSGDLRLVKPDPRMFTTFLDRTGVPAGQCLFIDDSKENIRVAGELGFDTIRYESPGQLREELEQRGLL